MLISSIGVLLIKILDAVYNLSYILIH